MAATRGRSTTEQGARIPQQRRVALPHDAPERLWQFVRVLHLPRMHLAPYHGVFAPHSRLRAAITPAGRGAGGKGANPDVGAPAVPKHVAMGWAQRLKRVFAIEIDTCARCQGQLGVIARILAHRQRESVAAEPELAPIAAPPPRQGRLPM
jgi:hypothetical protein